MVHIAYLALAIFKFTLCNFSLTAIFPVQEVFQMSVINHSYLVGGGDKYGHGVTNVMSRRVVLPHVCISHCRGVANRVVVSFINV